MSKSLQRLYLWALLGFFRWRNGGGENNAVWQMKEVKIHGRYKYLRIYESVIKGAK